MSIVQWPIEESIAFLLPYFGDLGGEDREARIEIIETLAAYATRARAEMLKASQIIALGMTTLDVLSGAKTTEMSSLCGSATAAVPTASTDPR